MNLRGQAGLIIPVVMLVVFIIIGFALAPAVSAPAMLLTNTSAGANMSTAGGSMAALIPLLYIVIVVVAVLGFMAMGRND